MNFPNDENGTLLNEMTEAGIDLTQTLAVDFFHLFEKQDQAQQMVDQINKDHPDTQVTLFEDDTPGAWDVNCTINMVPSYDNICQVEKNFEILANKCGGYADGWGIMAE